MLTAERRPTLADELKTLRTLWSRQQEHAASLGLGDDPGMRYLASHFALDITLRRHLAVLDDLAPYIRGRVLEWGCRHGLDSCVYRMRLGDAVELQGCDVCGPDEYRPFHDASGLNYVQLHHPFLLDYEDESFDVVTSNGVLEHVPDDRASCGEVFRVLKPGGVFAVTCLPNRFSYTEAFQRRRGGTAHDRLYTLGSARRLLEGAGFRVVRTKRFLVLPSMLNGFPRRVKALYHRLSGPVWRANAVLEKAWPLNLLASNLMLIAVKPSRGS